MRPRRSGALIRNLLITAALVGAVRQWVYRPLLIVGESMEPTLRDGEFAGVNKLAFLCRSPRRGEVVVLWTGHDLAVKRIVGLPGEELSLRRGVYYINGTPLAEPYVDVHSSNDIGPAKLSPEQFVVTGDNRPQSFTAVVNRQRILGRLVLWRDLRERPSSMTKAEAASGSDPSSVTRTEN